MLCGLPCSHSDNVLAFLVPCCYVRSCCSQIAPSKRIYTAVRASRADSWEQGGACSPPSRQPIRHPRQPALRGLRCGKAVLVEGHACTCSNWRAENFTQKTGLQMSKEWQFALRKDVQGLPLGEMMLVTHAHATPPYAFCLNLGGNRCTCTNSPLRRFASEPTLHLAVHSATTILNGKFIARGRRGGERRRQLRLSGRPAEWGRGRRRAGNIRTGATSAADA